MYADRIILLYMIVMLLLYTILRIFIHTKTGGNCYMLNLL